MEFTSLATSSNPKSLKTEVLFNRLLAVTIALIQTDFFWHKYITYTMMPNLQKNNKNKNIAGSLSFFINEKP